VELIVVIVIIGILAAVAVPSLVGYIDKARDDTAKIEGSAIVRALQGIMSEGKSRTTATADSDVTLHTYSDADGIVEFYVISRWSITVEASSASAVTLEQAVTNLTGIALDPGAFRFIRLNSLSGFQLQELTIKLSNDRYLKYDNGSFTVSVDDPDLPTADPGPTPGP
jgi:type II secretory pathway pseudopilin PulG